MIIKGLSKIMIVNNIINPIKIKGDAIMNFNTDRNRLTVTATYLKSDKQSKNSVYRAFPTTSKSKETSFADIFITLNHGKSLN